MKMRLSPLVVASVLLMSFVAGAEGKVLWQEGDFKGAKGAKIEKTPDGDVLLLPNPSAGLSRTLRLEPDWRVLRLRGEMKVTDVPTCAENWRTGRFALRWTDDRGKTVTPWPGNIGHVGTTDWIRSDKTYVIPKGATRLEVGLSNLSTGGEVRFRNFSIEMVRSFMAKPGNDPLPEGAPANAESLADAWRVDSPLRTRVCMNGLWRIRPAFSDDVPGKAPADDDGWSWARIPDLWTQGDNFDAEPRLAAYIEDHPERTTKILPLRAWYARTFEMPVAAKDRRALVTFDMVASRAEVYVDGKRAGAVAFPNGEVDITPFVRPGERQTLALDVTAYAEGETLDYNEATRADKRKVSVKHKGITGDLWLDFAPKGTRIVDAWVETSVEKGEAKFVIEAEGKVGENYRMRAEVTPISGGKARAFEGVAVAATDGRYAFVADWKDAELWDVDTPQNRYSCKLSLIGNDGKAIDTFVPFEFGFREVKIVGRDLFLNGKKIHLRALYDATLSQRSTAASKPNAIVRCRNVMAYGFNFMIAGNYSFGAGSTPYIQGILDACDETGMLYAFTMPHFKDFEPMDKESEQARYRDMARKMMRLARRHPAVIAWAASHNAAGYLGAGKPHRIDGLYELPAHVNGTNRRHARLARKIIGELDPSRPCYHHESGNLDEWHCFNCYLDWSPVQERSDWPEHWASVGVKPLFFVEWGLPHISTWSSYRGPLFIWRGRGYMSLWASEYAAALRGDAAYEATPETYRALDCEERLWAGGAPFRWSSLCGQLNSLSNNYAGVQATYVYDNWRSFRGWGVTAALPWDQETFFRQVRRGDVKRADDYYAKTPGWKTYLCCQWADAKYYDLTSAGLAVTRWNREDCAWIGGGDVFTTKRHHYRPNEELAKTLVIVNDRRHAQKITWSVGVGNSRKNGEVSVEPGGCAKVPVVLTAPEIAGRFQIKAEFGFEGGNTFRDEFEIEVMAPYPCAVKNLAVFDPSHETEKNLRRLGIPFKSITNSEEFVRSPESKGAMLVVGYKALSRDILDRALVPLANAGGRVFIFEQTKATLESVGFRVQEYGLRHAFARFEKPTLKGVITDSRLRDWAGSSLLVAPFDPLKEVETGAGESATWAGFPNQSRVWKCGNRGTVASVIPEKPSFGDWCALVDGGFDLQYAPLLEWRLGGGAITFCQLDVTCRTGNDPAADDIVRAMLMAAHDPMPKCEIARPLGMQAFAIGRQPRHSWFLEHDDNKKTKDHFLVTEGATEQPADFFECITNGATALLCGLSAKEIQKWCPMPVSVKEVKGRHFTRIEKLPPELNGLSNADWAWHGKMDFAAFTGKEGEGNEALRIFRVGKGVMVFWQVPPWKINAEERPYLRTSKRRAEAMLSRLMSNLGFRRGPGRILYADVPESTDDPYRYYHW